MKKKIDSADLYPTKINYSRQCASIIPYLTGVKYGVELPEYPAQIW